MNIKTKKGLLIVISGPSGVGKGTICKSFFAKNNNDDIKLSVSCTTRKPRIGEKDKLNYFFVENNKFEDMIKNNEFLEYAKVYDNYYGTPESYVEENLNKGITIVLEIDIQGALNVKRRCPDGVFIFILPPSMEELKYRIIKRGSESEDSFKKRFNSAYDEIKFITDYNYVIVNDTIDNSVKHVENIIEAEKCKVDRIDIDDILKEELK